MKSNLYDDLTGFYSLSKTLRFELKPIGKTKENLMKDNILIKDKDLKDSSEKLKSIINEVHKKFIDEVLSSLKLNNLNDYYEYLVDLKKKAKNDNSKETMDLKQLISIKEGQYKKEISNVFLKSPMYKVLFSQDLIKNYLKKFLVNKNLGSEENLNLIEKFKNFTTYFKTFNENRMNLYSSEGKIGSIPYRIINENLQIFINNIKIFKIIKERNADAFDKFIKDFNVDIDSIFNIENFNNVITESGIEKYNKYIIGVVAESKKGLNEYINLLNQSLKLKLPKFTILKKQILSDKLNNFYNMQINSDEQVFNEINNYYKNFKSILDKNENIFCKIKNIKDYDLNKIYIRSGLAITELSNKIFDSWDIINNALNNWYEKNIKSITSVKNIERYNEDKKKYFKNRKQYSIQFLEEILVDYNFEYKDKIINYIINLFQDEKKNGLLDVFEDKYQKYLTISFDTLQKDEKKIEIIKNLLDSIKLIQENLKNFTVRKIVIEKDEEFYSVLIEEYEEIKEIVDLYNKVRDYITKKPFSIDKIKLNFGKSTLLSGWDVNKEKENLGTLFEKDGFYYIGIINKNYNKIFDSYPIDEKENYRKMIYKYTPDVTKQIPKCSTQLKDVHAHFKNNNDDYYINNKKFNKPFKITKEIYELNNVTYNDFKKFQTEYLKQTNDIQGYIDAKNKWINFCMDWLRSYNSTKDYDFTNIKEASQYNNISEFYNEINQILYKISFVEISAKYINELVDAGKLYLFQIYSKDFSIHSKGKPNLHTIYFKTLFDSDNIKNTIYKLNGEAEIFYREASLEPKVIHPKEIKIKNKNPLNERKESLFKYDLIKDRRYTVDKYLLHIPLTINFKNKEIKNINPIVNKILLENDSHYVIGIDRGERNLIYLVLIDSKGKIIKQFSMNIIENEKKHHTNYHSLLNDKEKGQTEAKQSWRTVESIKELKDGYLSQIINKIIEIAIEYNAVIVMEDLNSGFKNSRIKIGKQVYQKFEKKLIEKLNFVVMKDKNKKENGGFLNGYQLTNKFESFEKLGKQSGILFYIPAWNTSKIDPTTGFINRIFINYESVEKSKQFIEKFDDIKFNEKENYYEFITDYRKFNNMNLNTKNNWIICTNSTRIKRVRNKEINNNWDYEEVILTNKFNELFEKNNIDKSKNLKQEILKQNSPEYFKELINLIKLMVQIRNSSTKTNEDYLISPVKNKNNKFYDSRDKDETLPTDADANGAFNIARKGLMVIEQIKKSKDIYKPTIKITNQEWSNYCQKDN